MKLKAPPLLVILLLAAIVLVDLAVRVMAGPAGWPADPADILLVALALSQTSLLGFWLGMGKSPLLVRFFGVCTGVVLLGLLLSGPPGFFSSRELLALFILAFVQAMVFFGLRIAGFRLEPSGTNSGETDPSAAPGFRVRYSIWNIIEWTICVAIFLALSRTLNFVWSDLVWSQSVSAVIFFSAISAIAFSSAWAILRARRLWPWFIVIGGIILSFGVLLNLIGIEFIMAILYALLLFGMFLTLRASGYRIVRVGPPTDDSLAGNGNEPEVAE